MRDDIRGVPFTSMMRTNDVKISGYADDTAIYLRDRSAVFSVVKALDDFAAVSCLQTNREKCIIIKLDPRGSSMPFNTIFLQTSLLRSRKFMDCRGYVHVH